MPYSIVVMRSGSHGYLGVGVDGVLSWAEWVSPKSLSRLEEVDDWRFWVENFSSESYLPREKLVRPVSVVII